MSTNKTEHLNLHQWEAADPFLREEFNENFAAIDERFGATDAAIARKPSVVVGQYTGNGSSSQIINLGFRPKVVVVDKLTTASAGCELGLDGIDSRSIAVVDNGFRATGANTMNESGKNFRYYAFS